MKQPIAIQIQKNAVLTNAVGLFPSKKMCFLVIF